MDFLTLTHDLCRGYVEDSKGLICEELYNQVHGAIRARDISFLASCYDTLAPAYQGAATVRFLLQVSAFYKKNQKFAQPQACERATEAAFLKGELLCSITNKRLDHYFQHEDRLDPVLRSDIRKAQNFITKVLGEQLDYYENYFHNIRVTSGATATLPRSESFPTAKFRIRRMEATRSARPFLRHLGESVGFNKMSFKACESNRVTTVPKNWKTNRTIACEPAGNLSLQLTVDEYIKDRLRKYGIDLSSQCRNQWMAHEGSINDNYVTIDLSMASDTVSYNAVWWLLPFNWANYLSKLRCKYGAGFGKVFKYAKFSSMGNGFTFALETLIFAAFCKAVGAEDFAVYGDDIIVHRDNYLRLAALLKFFGFQVNQDKSYLHGPFRESCGSNWYDGINVTPKYCRFETGFNQIEIIHIVNTMAMIAIPGGKLEALLLSIVRERSLPLVPFTENSTQGIWIDVHSSYKTKLFRYNHGFQRYKAFVAYDKKVMVTDIRALTHWHFDARRRHVDDQLLSIRRPKDVPIDLLRDYRTFRNLKMNNTIERSRVSANTTKYKRKWVHWIPPVVAVPVHLYRWSDLLTRVSR